MVEWHPDHVSYYSVAEWNAETEAATSRAVVDACRYTAVDISRQI